MAVAADEVGGKLDDMESSENSDLSQELQVLKEIYITELSINRDASGQLTSIDVQLHPATGENVSQKWVCLTLQLIPPPDYPHSIPEICIRGPRGLADEHVASMKKSLYQIAEDRKGEPMMYELIESAKESLTQLNIPYGQCMICLDDFGGCHQEFTKTDCYHYFHCGCLSMYVNHCKAELEALEPRNAFAKTEVVKQIVCPVCRELLPSDIDLSAFQADSGAEMSEERFIPSEEMQRLQRTMADLFEKQKQKGGIIDLDEERNKYLLPKDFVYVGSVEESSQDAPLSESVQAVSALTENDKTSRTPQQQRQREYGGREGNKGMREHERGGGRGARRNRRENDYEKEKEYGNERREYDNERREYGNEKREYGNERREYGNERGEYGRRQGDHGRDREYAKERSSTYGRERGGGRGGGGGGYRRPKQEERERRWRNEEGSRSDKFDDQKKGVGICSKADEEAQNKSAVNEKVSIENGNIEKVGIEKVEQAVETEQRIETENSGLESTVTPDIQVEGGSAELGRLQKVDDVKPQRTTKNSRQNDDASSRGREAPSKKPGNFPRRDRRQEHDRYYDQRVEEKFPRRNLQKPQHRGEGRQDFRAKRSDDTDRSERSTEIPNSSEQIVKETETPQKEETENDKKLENAAGTEVTSSCQGQSEPIGSGNLNSSKESSAQKLENVADSEQGKSEAIRSGNESNVSRKSSARDNHYRQQRNRRQDQDQNQYHEDRSKSNVAKKEELLKEKRAGERRDSLKDRGSEMTSKHPEQPKDLSDGQTKTSDGVNTNDESILPVHINKPSAQRQSSRPENHFKQRLHARGNAVRSRDMDDRRVDTGEPSREHQHKDVHSKPKAVADRKAKEYPDKAAINQRNFRNPQRSEAKSYPKDDKQFNDRQKFRKDTKSELARDRSDISESRPTRNDISESRPTRNDISESRPARSDISESRPARNDRPIYDEPSSSLNAANSKSDRSSEVHPGFHIRSIARVEAEQCKTLDV